MVKKEVLLSLVFGIILLLSLTGVFAINDLLALQGNIKNETAYLPIGNLTIYIYDAVSGGNLVYNSGSELNSTINNGTYDVLLGNNSGNELALEFGKLYYLEMYANGEQFSFGGLNRQVFQSGVGNISLGDLDFSDGQNVSLIEGWFKGMFNWVINSVSTNYLSFNGTSLYFNETKLNITINSLASSSGGNASWNETYADTLYAGIQWAYNMSDGSYNLTYNTWSSNYTTYSKWWYNMTTGTGGDGNASWNETYADTLYAGITWAYNQTVGANTYADATFLRKDGDNGTGIYTFGGDWDAGGVRISNGNIFAQTLYVYNISSLKVDSLQINGSISPGILWNNTFDIGVAGDEVWRYGYFGEDVLISGASVKKWMYNMSDGSYNATYHGLNVSYNKWWYNQSSFAYALNTSQSKWWYNMTADSIYDYNFTGTGIYYYNQTFAANTSIYGAYGKWWYNMTSSLVGGVWQSNTTAFWNSTATKIGIGTATPSSLLEVAGNINISGAYSNLTVGGGRIYWDNAGSRLVIKVS